MKKLILLMFVVFILCSCEKEKPNIGSVFRPSKIYKKKDPSYFNYVTVYLSKDFKMMGHSGDYNDCIPILLDSSYYYEPSFSKIGTECYFVTQAEKTAIVDIKIAEYHYFNIDTMQKHLLSHDLFTEYYEEDEESDTFYITNTTTFAHDTALINSWIRKGELGKYLKRLK
jgi:hypothetical protein